MFGNVEVVRVRAFSKRTASYVRRTAGVAIAVAMIHAVLPTSSVQAFTYTCAEADGSETYAFGNIGGSMPTSAHVVAVREGLDLWAQVADFQFIPVSISSNPETWITWYSGSHGDGIPFDGPGGSRAHTFSPCESGGIHFDAAETWSVTTGVPFGQPAYMKSFAIHEGGHALGLGESTDPTSVMYEHGEWMQTKLAWDDIAGVQHLYGRNRGVYHLRDSMVGGNPHKSFYWADLGDTPVAGDWNNDGTDTIGVYRPSTQYWYLRDTNESKNATYAFKWGSPGDRAVVGDWDGNGTDTVGIYRPGNNSFYLLNKNSGGVANHIFGFGNPEDLPVAGDWNEDGIDTVGVYRPSNNTFYLSNQVGGGTVHYVAQFGTSGDLPVVGDWNNSGTDTIGVYRPKLGFFELRDSNSGGASDYSLAYGRSFNTGAVVANGRPVSGDWNGDGAPTIGLYQN